MGELSVLYGEEIHLQLTYQYIPLQKRILHVAVAVLAVGAYFWFAVA